jgi:hypothetical protein
MVFFSCVVALGPGECAIAPLVRRWKINDGALNAPSIFPLGAPMMAAQISAPSMRHRF